MRRVARLIAPGALGGSAALAGGAAGNTRRCQGCRPILVGLVAFLAAPAFAGADLAALDFPVSAYDIIAEPPVFRVRYLAPDLADSALSYVDVADRMEHLCTQDALPRLIEQGSAPDRIVITLMAEPVEFGASSPGIRQFFESYEVRDGLCIWEAF